MQGGKTQQLRGQQEIADSNVFKPRYPYLIFNVPSFFYSFVDSLLSSVHPPCNPAYLCTVSLGRSMAQHEVRFLIELSWRVGDVLMRPGPVFILTFESLPYRCPSSNLKRNVGACQATPEVSDLTKLLCRAWHFHLNLIRSVDFFFLSHYTGPGVPITNAILQQDEQDVLWSHV